MLFSVSQNFCSGVVISFQHFDGEDVVNLNVMSGESVVQERRRKHHLISREPEFGIVLIIKGEVVSTSDESESIKDEHREPAVHEYAGVAQRSAGDSQESGSDSS